MAALWGLGHAAVAAAAAAWGWLTVRSCRAAGLSGQVSMTLGVMLLVASLTVRAIRGHGWPLISSADTAAGIAIVMLLVYLVWASWSGEYGPGLVVAALSLILLTWATVAQFQSATRPWRVESTLISGMLNMVGGACLGLAAAVGLYDLGRRGLQTRLSRWHWATVSANAGELSVRAALLFLAVALALDVWWGQKLDLGVTRNAQQAGTAIAWMVYFVAVRLRSHLFWRGWAWSAVLVIGFVCILPILLNVSWLETTLTW